MEDDMKTDLRHDSADRGMNKTYEIDPDTLVDIMERINGLSFDRPVTDSSYLAQISKGKNGLKPLQRYFELRSIGEGEQAAGSSHDGNNLFQVDKCICGQLLLLKHRISQFFVKG